MRVARTPILYCKQCSNNNVIIVSAHIFTSSFINSIYEYGVPRLRWLKKDKRKLWEFINPLFCSLVALSTRKSAFFTEKSEICIGTSWMREFMGTDFVRLQLASKRNSSENHSMSAKISRPAFVYAETFTDFAQFCPLKKKMSPETPTFG